MKTQLILDQREVAEAISAYVTQRMAPGLVLDVEVFVHGEHPKKTASKTAETRRAIWQDAMARASGLTPGNKSNPNPEDTLLAEWGALVIIHGTKPIEPSPTPAAPGGTS